MEALGTSKRSGRDVGTMFHSYSVAMVTPFSADGDLDLGAVAGMTQYLISSGVTELLISGSTGEQHSMTPEERKALYREAVRAADGRARIIAGVAATTTRVAVDLARGAQEAGAYGIMLGLPPYIRASDLELEGYVTTVAQAVNLPILLYNNPPRTGTDIGMDTVARLAAEGRVAALKHSSDYPRAQDAKRRTGGKLQLFTGSDVTILDALLHDYTGITSIIGNLFPREMAEVVRLATVGAMAGAEAKHAFIRRAATALFATATPVGLKYALRKRGLPAGYPREPLGHITEEQRQAIDAVVESA